MGLIQSMAAIVNLLAKEKGDAFAKQAIVFADTPTHRHTDIDTRIHTGTH